MSNVPNGAVISREEIRIWCLELEEALQSPPRSSQNPVQEIPQTDRLRGMVAYLNPPAATPSTVTPAQAKIALFNAGLFDQVEALVSGYPYKPVELWWTSANNFERGNAYLQALAVEMGLSDSQVDDLFVAAAKL